MVYEIAKWMEEDVEIGDMSGEEYFVSGIKEYKANLRLSDDRSDRRRFLHDRYTEAQLHSRNITPISSDGHPICPKCGKKHI